LLRAENQVHQHVRERLRHGSEYSAGLQPASVIVISSWDCAPGYTNADFQPACIRSNTQRQLRSEGLS
jgi:hypothetical protein